VRVTFRRVADLVSGFIGLLLATNQAAAASNFVAERTGARIEISATSTNSPIEQEYLRILAMDNAAQEEVDRWITEDQKFAATGAAADKGTLRGRIRQRLEPVDKAYQDFLSRNPAHTRARLAYGSFRSDTGREEEAHDQWEKAREIDPKDPAAWNNLANYYGHNGPATKAFEYYEKAIALAPTQSVYFQNFATTVYLFRRDATNYFRISEQQVFDKALALYRQSQSLDPGNFPLATDVAQTFYGIKPPRAREAIEAWNTALKLARDEIEREGVHLHLARWYKTAGDLPAAYRELSVVTNALYTTTRSNVLRTLDKKQAEQATPPKAADSKPAEPVRPAP